MAHISSTGFRLPSAGASSPLFAFQDLDSQLIRCDIIFGMPSQDCRGTGICKINSNFDLPLQLKKGCHHSVAFAGRSADGRRLSLYFLRELLSINLYSRHFRKGLLEMTEPCPLPADLVEQLGLCGAVLLPGTYPVIEKSGVCRVDVNLDASPLNH